MMQESSAATPATGVALLVRSSLFAASAVWLALTAHVAGGGTAPATGPLAGLFLLISALGAVLAGRRRGPLGITAAMLALQYALHHVFAFLSTGFSCHSMPAGQPMEHSMHAAMAMSPACSTVPGSAMGTVSASMLISHVLAAVTLSLLLSQGERTLWLVLTWFLPPLPSVPPIVPVAARPAPTVAPRPPLRLRRELLSSGAGRRGPPQLVEAPA
jgi:hypothetical protein